MQRLISQLKTTNDQQKQALMASYDHLLQYRDSLCQNPFSDRRFVEVVNLQRTIHCIQTILDEIGKEPIQATLEKLRLYLGNRWEKISEKPSKTYLLASHYPENVFCLALAELLSAEDPVKYPKVNELLMPTITEYKEDYGKFILSEDAKNQLPLIDLVAYCQSIVDSPCINIKYEPLVNCTKEGKLLFQAAMNYGMALQELEYREFRKELVNLSAALLQGKKNINQDGSIGNDVYLALIKFSEFFNSLKNKQSLLENKAFTKLWENLTTTTCIDGMEKSVDRFIAIFGYDKEKEGYLEEFEFEYQAYLELFTVRLKNGSLIWNKDFSAYRNQFLNEILKTLSARQLIEELAAFDVVKAYIIKLMDNNEFVKYTVNSELPEWIKLFQKLGIPDSKIQAALINIMDSDIEIDKSYFKSLIALGANLTTLFHYAKNNTQNTAILNVLFEIEPDYKNWIKLLREDRVTDPIIISTLITFFNNAVDKKSFCQDLLENNFTIDDLFNVAIEKNNCNFLKSLHQLRPDFFERDFRSSMYNGYKGPLSHLYVLTNNLQKLQLLKQAEICDEKKLDHDGETLLTFATRQNVNNFAQVVALFPNLVNVLNANEGTPLMLAAMFGNRDKVEILLKAGCDLNVKNKNGLTALDLASKYGNSRIARWLLERNADFDKQKMAKEYIHGFIIQNGRQDNFLKELVKHDIDLTQCDEKGNTPLMTALLYGSYDIVKLLLEKAPACVFIKNKAGLSPTTLGVNYGDCRQELVQNAVKKLQAQSRNGLFGKSSKHPEEETTMIMQPKNNIKKTG